VVHRTVRWANSRPHQRSAAQSARDAWTSQRSDGCTGLSGVHQTVRCAPDSVRCANGSKSAMVDCANLGRRSAPDSEQWMFGGAPDCPVRHPIEGKNCLLGLLPMASRPLGPIKGTSRRLKQAHKRSQQYYTSLGSILTLPLVWISLVCVEGKTISL
jgi:hypothetical protein